MDPRGCYGIALHEWHRDIRYLREGTDQNIWEPQRVWILCYVEVKVELHRAAFSVKIILECELTGAGGVCTGTEVPRQGAGSVQMTLKRSLWENACPDDTHGLVSNQVYD